MLTKVSAVSTITKVMVALGNESVLDGRWKFSRPQASNDDLMTNVTNENYEISTGAMNYQQLAYALMATLGIFGNAVVIFVILHSASMRSKFTNILILNQSSIDFATSVLILISKVLKSYNENLSGVGGDILCKFWLNELPLWSLMVSSSYSLMAMTIERYMGIVHPMFHHTSFSKTNVIFLACASWWPGPILMLCFMVPTYDVINGSCTMIKISDQSLRRAIGVALFVMQYLIPITVFITCYSRMFIRLRTHVHPEAPNLSHEATVKKARARRNVLKTLLLVVIGYLLCNSWNQLTFLAFNIGAPLDFSSNYYNFSVIAMFANCCINPFLYALQYRPYQNELQKIFCKRDTSVVSET